MGSVDPVSTDTVTKPRGFRDQNRGQMSADTWSLCDWTDPSATGEKSNAILTANYRGARSGMKSQAKMSWRRLFLQSARRGRGEALTYWKEKAAYQHLRIVPM
jgi:hypothetical protein